MSLEASMNEQQWRQAKPYFFALQQEDNGLWQINPGPLWLSLLSDLQHQVPAGVMAARFHKGLARVWADCLQQLAGEYNVTHVVFTGGVFQNRHLTEEVIHLLQQSSEQQLTVLAHSQVPANDGGIALGQALITAARCLQLQQTSDKRSSPCV